MTAIAFGTIVLTDFPFTDLSSAKRRPALVISSDNDRRTDIVVAYITSVVRMENDAVPLAPTAANGLKVPSMVRFDKVARSDRRILSGCLGIVDLDWLEQQRGIFFGVFGFKLSRSM
jgi:mRNA interferase MazF